MEKNRIRPIKTGKSFRMSYSRQQEVLEMPNLIEVQKDSYQWFLDRPKNWKKYDAPVSRSVIWRSLNFCIPARSECRNCAD